MNKCIQSNTIGTNAVFDFCLKNKIKLIYSATSASLGNKGKDKNLSPYAFTKAKNLELLENLKKWFNFKYEVIFFYNVYGPKHIKVGNMATVIGIFEDAFIKGKPLPVVKPGSQSRRFTHINDTIDVCYEAWIKNKNRYYSIANKKNYTILEVAKLFGAKIKFLPPRRGERYASALSNMSLSNKVFKRYGKTELKNILKIFKKPHKTLKVRIKWMFTYKFKYDNTVAGDYCVGAIPDPISNSSQALQRRWYFVLRHEDRSLPALQI